MAWVYGSGGVEAVEIGSYRRESSLIEEIERTHHSPSKQFQAGGPSTRETPWQWPVVEGKTVGLKIL